MTRGVHLLLALLALLGGAMAAQAAPVPVRSGEHATFTRLVFADTGDSRWTADRPGADSFALAFSGPPPDLDLSGVFDRIPRSRLLGVSLDGARLVLDLACACKVEASRIPSGHVVIDILDERIDLQDPISEAAAPGNGTARILPLRLPPAPLALPVLAAYLPAIADNPSPSSHTARDLLFGAPQVRITPDRQRPLVHEDRDTSGPDTVRSPACPIEPLARDILQRDPVTALAGLTSLTQSLLDGEDRLDLAAARTLSLGYLSAGMGAEAIQVQRVMADDSPDILAIGAAFDDMPRPPGVTLDPACGPATTLVALLDSGAVSGWNRADLHALRVLMDDLPPARWQDIEARLRRTLETLGAEDIMTGLHADWDEGDPGAVMPDPAIAAAGTDETAVEAAIALIARANADGVSSPERHLVNAMALRQSLPDGPLRRKLETTLATGLVLARHPAEATELVREGAVLPAQVLSDALTHLPAPVAAEFAVRLRPLVGRDDADGQRIDDLLAHLGLSQPAGNKPQDAENRVVEVKQDIDPWLARDLNAMAAAPDDDGTDRNRVARMIVERNGRPLPQTDLARAGQILDDSRQVSVLIRSLVTDPPS